MNRTFLVDVDGVVAQTDVEWLKLYNHDYGDEMTVDDWTHWYIHNLVKPECGTKIYDYLWRYDLYDKVLPMDGAVSGIHWLRERGNRVVFVTSGVQPAKIQWLEQYGLISNWKYSSDVVVAHDKSIIMGDILIDDRIENCQNFHGMSWLFKQPWNSGEDAPLTRVNNWSEIVEKVTRL